jgi:hypothetical protein
MGKQDTEVRSRIQNKEVRGEASGVRRGGGAANDWALLCLNDKGLAEPKGKNYEIFRLGFS